MAELTDDYPQHPGTPGRLTLSAPQRGEFERPLDRDWYAISLEAGKRYLFSLDALPGVAIPMTGSREVFALAVYDARGQMLTRILDGAYRQAPVIEFAPPASGTYYVEAISRYSWGGLGGYELAASLRTGADDQPDSTATTSFLPRDGAATGSFEVAGDIDWVRFSVQPGVHYRFEFEAPDIGVSSPYVAPSEVRILDASGRFVQYLDWGFSPSAAGDYYLELRGLEAGQFKAISHTWTDDYLPNNETRGYLAPGALERGMIDVHHDVDRFRLAVEEGVFYTITIAADAGIYSMFVRDAFGKIVGYSTNNIEDGSRSFVFRAGAASAYFLDVERENSAGDHADPYSYAVGLSPGLRDLEGDTMATARQLAAGAAGSGVLEGAADVDMYRIALTAGERYAITLGGQGGHWESFVLRVLAADGTTVAFDDGNDDNLSLAIGFTPQAGGDYYLQVSTQSGGVHPYSLAATPLRGDTVAPVLVSSSHADGASGIALTENGIVLRFSEAIAITKSMITITGPGGGAVGQGSDPSSTNLHSPFVQGSELLINTWAHFLPGGYTIHLPRGSVRDLAGNDYVGPDTFTFTTVAPGAAPTPEGDLLAGVQGQRVDGGAGIDTLLLPGHAANYIVQGSAQEATARHELWGNSYELANIERLLFEHRAIALDIDGHGGQAYRLYRAAFDRTPDMKGLGFWIAQLDRGLGLPEVARAFIASEEFTGMYGSMPDDALFVDLLYRHVLQRAPEAEGAGFWLARLHDGVPREVVLAAFSESDENVAATLEVIANGFQYEPY